MLRRGHICYLIVGGLIIVMLMKIFLSQNEPKRKVEANHVIDTAINGEGEKEKQLIEDKGINDLLEKAKGATTLDIIQGGQNEENQGVVDPRGIVIRYQGDIVGAHYSLYRVQCS
ncbi:hypothetical protein Clole_0133 [Cellulosilyticum lentocellum DSM 5427]|uniref:Uncharacterized protein n=2 Tax=Cellulosilyticum lentocellum TaxID=29360 RepID=F2JH75_CELLD|nr:hypothetical protein Clole_0133 [Cellulosilyticum lentocellum DSM 5427]